MRQFTLPAHLTPATDACAIGGCSCAEPLAQREDNGGWYITLGHPGFNTPANNRGGYKSRAMALRAFAKCNDARKKHGAY